MDARSTRIAASAPGPRRRSPAWALAGAGVGVAAALLAAISLVAGPWSAAPDRNAASFVTVAELVDPEPVPLSPSIELLLTARLGDGSDPGEVR